MKNSLIKLGITGGIGSGKSFVSALFVSRGIPVFDSDTEARKLMLTDSHIINTLKSYFGDKVYVDGELNKPYLASCLFNSSENAEKINSLVHPCVREAFCQWAEKQYNEGKHIVAIESAILFESGFESIVDKVVMVHAPLEIRILRVMNRDNTSREKVIERIKSQLDDEQKMSRSDYVIENNGTESLDEQIDNIFRNLRYIKD